MLLYPTGYMFGSLLANTQCFHDPWCFPDSFGYPMLNPLKATINMNCEKRSSVNLHPAVTLAQISSWGCYYRVLCYWWGSGALCCQHEQTPSGRPQRRVILTADIYLDTPVSHTHDLSDTCIYSHQPVCCLSSFLLFDQPGKHNIYFFLFILLLFFAAVHSIRAQFYHGQAHHITPQLWGIVIRQSFLWSSAAGWAVQCLMPRLSFLALFIRKRSFGYYQVNHRAPGYGRVLSTLSLLPLITSVYKPAVSSSGFWSVSHILNDITPLLCAKLVTVLLYCALRRIYFPRIHFLQPVFYEIIDFQSCQRGRTLPSSVLAETQIQKGC